MSHSHHPHDPHPHQDHEPHSGHDHNHGYGHAHSHAHSHSHTHGPAGAMKLSVLILALVLVAEVIGGYLSGSLALLADAGHMLTDIMALSISLFALWLSKRPTKGYAYGMRRVEVMAAQVNGLLLMLLAVGIFHEAWNRAQQPYQIEGPLMMGVAVLGLLANLLIAKLLWGHHGSLNVKAALLHVLGDTLGSVGAIVAGAMVWWTGQTWMDWLVSGLIGVLIILGALRILWESTQLILGAEPRHIPIADLRALLLGFEEIQAICDLHLWNLNSQECHCTAHLIVKEGRYTPELLPKLIQTIQEHWDIDHITLQLEEGSLTQCGACLASGANP